MPTANKSSKVVMRLQKELPQSIIALPCEDKGFHEKFDSANIGNLAHPFRSWLGDASVLLQGVTGSRELSN